MNALQVIIVSIRLYTSKMLLYSLLGFLLFLTVVVSAGISTSFFLADCLIALYLGSHGTWIHDPAASALIGASSLAGALFGTYLLFGSVGAFVHTCAQIGAGRKDVSLLSHLDYLAANAHRYWIVGMAQQTVAAFPLIAVMSVALLAGSANTIVIWAGVAISILLYMAAQYPFWLAVPAMVVRKCGVVESLRMAMVSTMRSPVGSAAMLLILYVMAIAPAISLVLYPIYFFIIFCPFAAVLALAYYEASEGLI